MIVKKNPAATHSVFSRMAGSFKEPRIMSCPDSSVKNVNDFVLTIMYSMSDLHGELS
jgi:hypothetical protein